MIIGCDSVPLRPMRCITVDSPNSLYLAGEAMIPTHNTRSETEWVDYRARRKRYGEQILVAGRTPSDVRDYVIEGPGGFLRHHPDITWEPGNRVLRWPNGVVGLVRSGANPEEFRGYSGDTALLDEFAAWKYPEAAWNNMLFGLREGQDPRVVVGSTPRAIEILKRIVASDSTVTVSGSSLENRSNLAERYVRDVLDPLAGTRLGRQEIEGELLGDTPGALWTLDLIEQYRWPQGRAVPPLVRVVTGVDPQGVKDTDVDSDPAAADGRGRPAHETGIVVAGIDAAGELYVLEDASVNGRPIEWGRAAVRAHRKHGGDRIVAERNYGGDMVESTIRVVDANAPVTLVNASRGKIPRAEPIATLYERGRVHHVGMFKELEDEMCTYVPGGKSPNRMDALVWTCTELSAPSDDKEATVRVLRTAYRR
jgi:phage terminase large subunit-like protein